MIVNIVHSPPPSPLKNSIEALYSPAESKIDPLASPVKIITADEAVKSPVLSGKKNRRNPFFKGQPSQNTSSSSMLGLRDEVTEEKFSALSKFSKMRRTQIDEQVIVQSRWVI